MATPGEKVGRLAGVMVRRMAASDVSAGLSILQESPEAAAWSRGSLEDSASSGNSWVAEMGDRVAGILIGRIVADEFEILNLAVGKAYRRRGIATKLIAAAFEQAIAAGARQAFLEVRASNQGGLAFYARIGFRICGRRPNYYRDPVEDAVLLVVEEIGTKALFSLI